MILVINPIVAARLRSVSDKAALLGLTSLLDSIQIGVPGLSICLRYLLIAPPPSTPGCHTSRANRHEAPAERLTAVAHMKDYQKMNINGVVEQRNGFKHFAAAVVQVSRVGSVISAITPPTGHGHDHVI
ncbi:hypothetical protein J6590_012936 [Homalodisca vitripennis]|nr:hypothetical protein J6590_012936 [Homalodisca vitripennis]